MLWSIWESRLAKKNCSPWYGSYRFYLLGQNGKFPQILKDVLKVILRFIFAENVSSHLGTKGDYESEISCVSASQMKRLKN